MKRFNHRPRRQNVARLRLRHLEERLAPAIMYVTSTADAGAGSLRQAVLDANTNPGADTVAFDPTSFASPQTITLTGGEIQINDSLTVLGPAARVTVSGNKAGRIFNEFYAPQSAQVVLDGLTLTGGKSSGDGGAVVVGGQHLTLHDCTLTGNQAATWGGAVAFANGGDLVIDGCTLSGNTAATGGGAVMMYVDGSLQVLNSTLSGNTATGGFGGGAIYFYGTVDANGLVVRNSTISGNNSGTGGGGIAVGDLIGTLVVQNSTITANSASGAGGGIVRVAGPGNISLESTVVSGNSAPTGPDVSSTGSVTVKSSALGSAAGFTRTDLGGNLPDGVSLKLGPLADNGGPTQTHLPAPDSPLVGMGTNPAGLANDQRGAGYGRSRSGVDIGAAEAPTNFVVTNTNDAGPGSLRQAVVDANAFAGADTVGFDPTAFAAATTITLSGGEIPIFDSVTVLGPAARVTLNAKGASRIFNQSSASSSEQTVLDSLTLINGKTSGPGGAVLAGDEHLTLRNCTLSNNQSASWGGAVAFTGPGSTDLVIDGCTLSGNTAATGGGAVMMYWGGSSLQVLNSTLSGNTASGGFGGGAIYCYGNVGPNGWVVRNSTISGNTSGTSGGGIAVGDVNGMLVVQNSTITANAAIGGVGGGGIARIGGPGGISLESTVVSGNTAAAGPDIFSTAAVSAKACAIGSAAGFTLTDQGGNLPFGANLKLGLLADNGGPTQTYLPAADSPLVGKGTNPSGLTDDQRGPGYGRSRSGTDIGAVEASTSFVVSNANDSGTGSLRQAITDANAFAGADTVTFDPSAFAGAKTISLSSEIAITDSVTVVGPAARVTLDGKGASRIFNQSTASPSVQVVLDGLTLSNGKSSGAGGAILGGDEHLTLHNCTLSNSKSSSFGGAVAFIEFGGGNLVIQGCTISGNTAAAGGGGVAMYDGGSLQITDSTISGNTGNGGPGGGGVYFWGNVNAGGFQILNSTISGNTASPANPFAGGGGIILATFYGALVVQNSTITGNGTTAGAGGGIGHFYGSGTIDLISTIVSGNTGTNPDLSSATKVGARTCAIGTTTGLTDFDDQGGNLIGQNLHLGPLANNGGPTKTVALLLGSLCINAGSNTASLANDQRGSGFARTVGGQADIGAYEVQAAPPTVASVAVNDGSAQRSMVTSLKITFSSTVSFPNGIAAAFQLARVSQPTGGPEANAPLGLVSLNAVQSGNSVTLTFATGGAVPIDSGSSLIDGGYQLSIVAANVQGAGGTLDGNGDGSAGDNLQTPATGTGRIFRLFGDADGSGTVDVLDFGDFRQAFGTANSAFDFDGTGSVDVLDFGQFRQRFGTQV